MTRRRERPGFGLLLKGNESGVVEGDPATEASIRQATPRGKKNAAGFLRRQVSKRLKTRGLGSALGELEAFPGSGLAGLFTFLLAAVAGQETLDFQGFPQFGIGLQQSPGDAESNRTDLTDDTATPRRNDGVVFVAGLGNLERLDDLVLKGQSGEVLFKSPAVDGDLTGARLDQDPRDGGLAATGGGGNVGGFAHDGSGLGDR